MSQPIAASTRCVDCAQPVAPEDATPVESTADGALYVCTTCLVEEDPGLLRDAAMFPCGRKQEGFQGRPDIGRNSQPCVRLSGHEGLCRDRLHQEFPGVPTSQPCPESDCIRTQGHYGWHRNDSDGHFGFQGAA